MCANWMCSHRTVFRWPTEQRDHGGVDVCKGVCVHTWRLQGGGGCPLCFLSFTGSLSETEASVSVQEQNSQTQSILYRRTTTASFLIKCAFWGLELRFSCLYSRHLPG